MGIQVICVRSMNWGMDSYNCNNGILLAVQNVRMRDVTDGTSNTLIVAEQSGRVNGRELATIMVAGQVRQLVLPLLLRQEQAGGRVSPQSVILPTVILTRKGLLRVTLVIRLSTRSMSVEFMDY